MCTDRDLRCSAGSDPSDLREIVVSTMASPWPLLGIAPHCVATASKGNGPAIELTTISRRSEGPEPAEHRKPLSVYTHDI